MSSDSVLWLIAGPNGAGKTTVTRTLPGSTRLAQLRSLNPDEISKVWLWERHQLTFATAPAELLASTFIEAADYAYAQATEALQSKQAITLETVLSTTKYRSLVDLTLQLGGYFGLIYVAVASPEISARRIAARVRAGGHGVPADKLAARWIRSLEQLPWFLARAHAVFVYDNSKENPINPPVLVANKVSSKLTIFEPDLIPDLTTTLQRSLS